MPLGVPEVPSYAPCVPPATFLRGLCATGYLPRCAWLPHSPPQPHQFRRVTRHQRRYWPPVPGERHRCHIHVVMATSMSSLKERAGVKRGLACRFAAVEGLQGHGGMASRLACPGSCRLVRAGRRAGDGRAGQGRGCGEGYAVMSRPIGRCAAWQARWLPSSLRAARPGGPGAHGAGPGQVRARVNHMLVRAAAAGDTHFRGRAPGRAGSRSCRRI